MNSENKPAYQKCFECCIKKIIERRAYEIWEWRVDCGEPGNDKSDWQMAEDEILEKLAGGYKPLL